MKTLKITTLSIVTLIIVFSIFSCNNSKEKNKKVFIDINTPLTGPVAEWGGEFANGFNLGIEHAAGKSGATLDLYNRDISDFILEREVDVAVFGVNRRVENAGKLNTQGLELSLNYDVLDQSDLSWTTGVVLSTYKTTLEEFVIDRDVRANLGAPGQNATAVILTEVGREIGTIWGPVFEGVNDDGTAILADINGDGQLITGQDQALND